MIDSCGTVRCVLCCSHDGREPRTGPGPVQQPLHPAHRHEYSNPSLCAGWRLPRQLCIHHTAGAIICWNYLQKCRSGGLCLRITVKSFNFVDTNKFCGLTTMDMFVDTWMCGFQVILNTTGVNIYFVGILKFVDCPTNDIHEINCPTNKNEFSVHVHHLWPQRNFLHFLFVTVAVYFLTFLDASVIDMNAADIHTPIMTKVDAIYFNET